MTVYSYSQLESLWISAGGPKAVAPLMAAIAEAESGGNSTAAHVNSNGTTDRGLWQINSSHGSLSTFDPMANAKSAVSIYHSQGLSAWTTYNSGAYKKFMKGGVTPTSAGLTSSTSSAGGLLGIPSQITDFFSQANTVITALAWILKPSSWVRIGAFIAGVALLLMAVHALLAVGEGGSLLPKTEIVPVPV